MRPVESLVVDDDTPYAGSATGDSFGRGDDLDIDAEASRPAYSPWHERSIDDEWYVAGVRSMCQSVEVRYFEVWVGDYLGEDADSTFVNITGNLVGVENITEACFYTEFLESKVEQREGVAEEVGGGDDVIAGACDSEQYISDSSHSGGERHDVWRVGERTDALLKSLDGRVRDARIGMKGRFTDESVFHLFCGSKLESSADIYRHSDSAMRVGNRKGLSDEFCNHYKSNFLAQI